MFKFSIREILFLTALCATGLGWFLHHRAWQSYFTRNMGIVGNKVLTLEVEGARTEESNRNLIAEYDKHLKTQSEDYLQRVDSLVQELKWRRAFMDEESKRQTKTTHNDQRETEKATRDAAEFEEMVAKRRELEQKMLEREIRERAEQLLRGEKKANGKKELNQ
jgi:hypothetical protein